MKTTINSNTTWLHARNSQSFLKQFNTKKEPVWAASNKYRKLTKMKRLVDLLISRNLWPSVCRLIFTRQRNTMDCTRKSWMIHWPLKIQSMKLNICIEAWTTHGILTIEYPQIKYSYDGAILGQSLWKILERVSNSL